MSNIIADKKNLYNLKEVLECIRQKGINELYYCNILDIITPKKNGVDLVDYMITSKIKTAAFMPSLNIITINPSSLNSFMEDEVKAYNSVFEDINIKELKSYLPFVIIFHEMSHAYQYFMGKGLIDAPYKIVKEGYYNVYKYMDGTSNNKLIKYFYTRTSENGLSFLERNAQIETYDMCMKLAEYEDNDEMKIFFNKAKNMWNKNGYVYSKKGCLYETYKNSLLLKDYILLPKKESIPTNEKIRYGLEIDEYTRTKILSKE